VLDQVLVQQVLDAALDDLARVDDHLMVLLELLDVPLQSSLEHLAGEEFDIDDGGHHIVGDRCVEGFHHVHPLSFLLQLQVLRDVAHQHQQALLVRVVE